MLLTGLPPFRGSGAALRYAKATADVAPYDTTTVPSAAAQALVKRLLTANPRERVQCIEHVLTDPWMLLREGTADTTSKDDDSSAAAEDVDLSLVPTLFQDWNQRWTTATRKRVTR